ncbi:hypothetical protein L1049_001100 [Liquidambar formosana]|uniref:F-box domain-containing protein n=1 Tax=Liquidambar formosana TaxID=63359 RepID=A0AAP0NE19_LIQFO
MADNIDLFTYLPIHLLIVIISFLPFKEAAKTSILSRRWRDIWRATKNVELDESFFVKPGGSISDQKVQRRNFLHFAQQWIKNYNEPAVHNFRLAFARPTNFHGEMERFIAFATARGVKALALDFADPEWNDHDDDFHGNHVALFDLPMHIYGHRVLESLRLYSINFLVFEFRNFVALKDLSLGWVELSTSSLKALLLNCPSLESLSLKKCRNMEVLNVSAPNLRLKRLVIDKCSIDENTIAIEAPMLRFLQYCGALSSFYFDGPHCMQEANLDFMVESEFAESGDLLYYLLQEICCIRVLTVCSYMLQVIPTGEEPLGLSTPLHVRHLILKTAMHENEFYGISFFLKSCPHLETLSIEIGPAKIFEDYEPPYEFETHSFWTRNVLVFRCINRTLKAVEIKGFRGTPNELQLLKYLLKFGRVMEKLTLNFSREVLSNGRNMASYQQIAQQLQQFEIASGNLRLLIC